MTQLMNSIKTIAAQKWSLAFAICTVALLLRIGYPLIPGAVYSIKPPFDPLQGDQYYFDQTALGILHGEGYHVRNLYAYQPPLWTYFLAGLYQVGNINYNFVHVILIILGVLLVFLTFLIGTAVVNEKVGVISAALVCFYPQLIRYPSELLSENLYLPLFSSALLLLLLASKKNSQLLFFLSGIITGLAALTRETAFYFPLLVLVWLILSKIRLTVYYIPYVLGFILLISPWTYRNYEVLGAFIPLCTGPGVNLYSGNNPDTVAGFSWKVPDNMKDLWNQPSPPGSSKSHYEVLIYKESLKQGLSYIGTHPRDTFVVWLRRFFLFWSSPIQNLTQNAAPANLFTIGWLAAYLFVLSTFMGGVYVCRKDWRLFSICYLYIGFVMMTTIVIHFESRYRLPAIPVMILLSGIFIEKVWKKTTLQHDAALATGKRI